MGSKSNKVNLAQVGLILVLSAALFLIGIKWGLPGGDRDKLYSKNPKYRPVSYDEFFKLGTTQIDSYHPDELSVLRRISNMDPSTLDFNPKIFNWPTLYAYMVALGLKLASLLGIVYLSRSPSYYFYHPAEIANFYLVGRSITAIMGVLTVYFTYRLGKKLFDDKVGMLSALFVGISPLFVVYAHYMTPDVAMTMWVVISMLFAANIIYSDKPKWYALAGYTAGLAASTKYPGGIVVLGVVAAHYVSRFNRPTPKNLLLTLCNRRAMMAYILAALGFIMGTPYAILAFPEFRRDVLWQFGEVSKGQSLLFVKTGNGLIYHITSSLNYGLGIPLLIVFLAGIIYAILVRKKEDIALLGFIIPFYIIIGISLLRFARYTIPLIPFLGILGSRFILTLKGKLSSNNASHGYLRYSVGLFLIGSIGYTLLYSAAHVNLMTQKDIRTLAGEWVRQKASKGTKIGLFSKPAFYAPPLDRDRFNIIIMGNISEGEIDEAALVEEQPAYIIVTDYEYRQIMRLRKYFPGKAEFLETLIVGRYEIDGNIYKVKKFEAVPNLFGYRMRKRFPPQDWMYTYPTVLILAKTKR